MANRNECFSDFSKQKIAKERRRSLVSRMGDRELDGDRGLDGLPIFLTQDASLARFARWSSATREVYFLMFRTDSAQRSSIKCKNYLLKPWIYAQHINFLNSIWNFSLLFISPGDPAMKIPSTLEKFNVKPRKKFASCLCFQLTQNVRFKWNICNFKFNFLSRGHLESLNLNRIFLPLFKILPCYEGFLVT